MTADVEEQYRKMHQAAKEWDGQTHIVQRLQPKRPEATAESPKGARL
jgi:hypothetical protein